MRAHYDTGGVGEIKTAISLRREHIWCCIDLQWNVVSHIAFYFLNCPINLIIKKNKIPLHGANQTINLNI